MSQSRKIVASGRRPASRYRFAWKAVLWETRYGGLVGLKADARAANERDPPRTRRARIPERAGPRRGAAAAVHGRRPAPGGGMGRVAFADQLQAVLAGPHAEVTPPK